MSLVGMASKYHEELIRHPAVTADGVPCEILERITWERSLQADGTPSAAVVCNRRFDLATGEPVQHLGGDDYALSGDGAKLRMRRTN